MILSFLLDCSSMLSMCCSPLKPLFITAPVLPGSLSGQKSRNAWESAFHSLLRGTCHLLQRRSDIEARLSCANVLQHFVYAFYHNFEDLSEVIQQTFQVIGSSSLMVPDGPSFQQLGRVPSWNTDRRLLRFVGRA